MKKQKIVSLLLILCLAAVSLSGGLLTAGCRLFESISFTQKDITMCVGTTLDISPYIKIKNSAWGDYALSSDDIFIQIISATSVKAVAKGTATLKAKLTSGTKSAVIEINVEYDRPSSLSLRTTGELFQKSTDPSPVTLTATINAEANPDLNYDWKINGVTQQLTGAKSGAKSFTLDERPAAGEYAVAAMCRGTDVSAEKVVRVYDDYGAPELIYTGGRTFDEIPAVKPKITIDVDNPHTNPQLYAEWFVDGEPVQSGLSDEPYFELDRARAGKYKISAFINGQKVFDGDGREYIEIIYKGQVTPAGVQLNYSKYPGVQLTWDNQEDTLFRVEVNAETPMVTAGQTVLNKTVNAQEGRIDLFGLIDLSKSYSITVTSMDSEDGVFFGGEQQTVTFDALSEAAVTYLKKTHVSGNCYMTCDEDIYDVFEYLMIFRPGAAANGTGDSEITLYMAYSSQHNNVSLSNSFKQRLNITGSYTWSVSGSLTAGSKITVKMTFFTQNVPTAEGLDTQGKTAQKVFIAPKTSEIGYNAPLPIDDFPQSGAKAETSDQLFITVQRGYKPDCIPDSAAESMYAEARAVLSDIIDQGMDDAGKAAAIYDWVMFATSYDYDVTSITDTATAVKQAAFYLEGVFQTGFAVCDGISKAYSLLCGMAGIECIRVVGSVTSGGEWGEHAWNKVLIENEWYLVDATWGITRVAVGSKYKFGTKAWFLVNDADVAGRRIEKGGVYPATSDENYNWQYKNGLYIFDASDLSARMQMLAADIMEEKNYRAFLLRGQEYYTDYYAIEFGVSPTLIAEFKKANSPLSAYLGGIPFTVYADAAKLPGTVILGVN